MRSRSGILALLLLLFGLPATVAEAKLGEDISAYKAKVAKAYTLKSQSNKDGKTYCVFSINMNQQLKDIAPEFGGGLTISVDKGKIIGQSMVLRLGQSKEAAKAIAVRYALDFAFESLGRPVPKTKAEISDEVNSYTTVINNAMAGDPQNVHYPNVKGKITVTMQKDGSLVFAATPG